jgi:hypothetical protein
MWDLNFGTWFSLGTFQRIFATKFLKTKKNRFTMYVFIGDFSTNFRHKIKKKKKKKGSFAPLCVPLGLKKPGDFTMSEGIRLQIFKFFGGWVWSEGKKKKHARTDCVRPSREPTSINKSNDVQLELANLALEMLSMESMCMNMNL